MQPGTRPQPPISPLPPNLPHPEPPLLKGRQEKSQKAFHPSQLGQGPGSQSTSGPSPRSALSRTPGLLCQPPRPPGSPCQGSLAHLSVFGVGVGGYMLSGLVCKAWSLVFLWARSPSQDPWGRDRTAPILLACWRIKDKGSLEPTPEPLHISSDGRVSARPGRSDRTTVPGYHGGQGLSHLSSVGASGLILLLPLELCDPGRTTRPLCVSNSLVRRGHASPDELRLSEGVSVKATNATDGKRLR